MAAAIPLVMVAGAGLSAYGAMQMAQAQQSASNYNAELADRNATVSLQQATADVAQVRRQAAQAQGATIAGYGASGVTQEGSPTDVLSQSASLAKLDEANVLYRANLQAMGYHSNAELDRMAGKTAQQQGYLNAASSFLTGVGQAGASYSYATKGAATTTDSPAIQQQGVGSGRVH